MGSQRKRHKGTVDMRFEDFGVGYVEGKWENVVWNGSFTTLTDNDASFTTAMMGSVMKPDLSQPSMEKGFTVLNDTQVRINENVMAFVGVGDRYRADTVKPAQAGRWSTVSYNPGTDTTALTPPTTLTPRRPATLRATKSCPIR